MQRLHSFHSGISIQPFLSMKAKSGAASRILFAHMDKSTFKICFYYYYYYFVVSNDIYSVSFGVRRKSSHFDELSIPDLFSTSSSTPFTDNLSETYSFEDLRLPENVTHHY